MEPRTARYEDLDVGRQGQERAHLFSRWQQMLEVVEHQQRAPVAKLLQLADARGERDRRTDERRLLNRRQGDEDDSPADIGDQPGSDLQCQPRLAAPARPRQRDETRAASQHAAQLAQLSLATDELRALLGQAVRDRGRRCRGSRYRVVRVEHRGEPIPSPRNRCHRLRPQHLAQRRDLHLEVVFLNDQTRPDQIEQFVLADVPMAPFDQRHQYIESASAQLGGHPADEQLSRLGLHLEASESYGVAAHGEPRRAMQMT
jgi:hypothetical protein